MTASCIAVALAAHNEEIGRPAADKQTFLSDDSFMKMDGEAGRHVTQAPSSCVRLTRRRQFVELLRGLQVVLAYKPNLPK